MKMEVELRQQQILSQRMIQQMEILQMNAQELEDYVRNLALENPVMDLKESGVMPVQIDKTQAAYQRKLEWLSDTDRQNHAYYEDQTQEFVEKSRGMEDTLQDWLLSQVLTLKLSKREESILRFLILSLDERGYLTETEEEIAGILKAEETEIERMMKILQGLEPAGVGARSLSECLFLQLQREGLGGSLAANIIREDLDLIAKNQLDKLASKHKAGINEIICACDTIKSLNPKPGNAFANQDALRFIRPDAVVIRNDGELIPVLNDSHCPDFTINGYYQNLLNQTEDQETKQYLKKKLEQAQWVKECVNRRTSTLAGVLRVIVEKQSEFFLQGPDCKAALSLADIAQELDVSESTVSRAMKGKYLQCFYGIYPLNHFLAAVSVKNEFDEDVTTERVKQLIRKVVDEEDKKKPLSDQKIVEALKTYHIDISRRTVNKYRTILGIPDKTGRKEWETC